jgi:hypothetical protein
MRQKRTVPAVALICDEGDGSLLSQNCLLVTLF